jgi:hypothetical protein
LGDYYKSSLILDRPDPIFYKRLFKITRADIFDLRSRLLERCAPTNTGEVIEIVKIILREAVLRTEIASDPSERGVGFRA